MNRPNLYRHILASFLFLTLAFLFSPDWPNVHKILSNPMGKREIVFQVGLLLFFYLNYNVLVDRFYFPKRYISYSFLLLLVFLFLMFVPEIFVHGSPPPPHHPHVRLHEGMPGPPRSGFISFFVSRRFYLFMLVFLFSLILKIWQKFKQLKEEKTAAELSYLKIQINPHFLFNTLNSIYSLSLKKSDSTPDAIVKLSSMMRYVLNEARHDFVPLTDELQYLEDYLELQKLRLDSNVHFSYERQGDFKSKKIVPLILIPFLENAFKHGVNTEEQSSINLKVSIENHSFEFIIRNTKVKTNLNTHTGTGFGISNAKKRLQLTYSNAYTLLIENTETEFCVTLKIQLHD